MPVNRDPDDYQVFIDPAAFESDMTELVPPIMQSNPVTEIQPRQMTATDISNMALSQLTLEGITRARQVMERNDQENAERHRRQAQMDAYRSVNIPQEWMRDHLMINDLAFNPMSRSIEDQFDQYERMGARREQWDMLPGHIRNAARDCDADCYHSTRLHEVGSTFISIAAHRYLQLLDGINPVLRTNVEERPDWRARTLRMTAIFGEDDVYNTEEALPDQGDIENVDMAMYCNQQREEFVRSSKRAFVQRRSGQIRERHRNIHDAYLVMAIRRDVFIELAKHELESRWRPQMTWNAGYERMRGYMHMFNEQVTHRLQRTRAKPDTSEPIDWLKEKKIPETIEMSLNGQDFKAVLINETMRIWKEANEMGHCLWTSYTDRIVEGKYVVYHVKAKHLSKSGFTLGLRKVEKNRWLRNTQEGFVYDQLKGKKNAVPTDETLKQFCKHVEKQLEKIN